MIARAEARYHCSFIIDRDVRGLVLSKQLIGAIALSDKQFISAQQLLQDSFNLGLQVIEGGFRPNFIVGVWRGGTPVGIAVQELLDYVGLKSDHIAIRTSLYTHMERRRKQVRVHGLGYVIDKMNHADSLLIVDDVFDTGLSMQGILKNLEKRCRRNLPHDIRVATTYFKPSNNLTDLAPDYYVHETDQWLVFPHELDGLNDEELKSHKPDFAPLAERAQHLRRELSR